MSLFRPFSKTRDRLCDLIPVISQQFLDAKEHKDQISLGRHTAELERAIREAERVHEADLTREAQAHERSEAAADRQHDLDRMWVRARIDFWTAARLQDAADRRCLLPFVPPDAVLADWRSSLDPRPLLLFAPFHNESRAEGVEGSGFDLALRRRWDHMPWAADAQPYRGLFKRPLVHDDLDLWLIQRELGEHPIILVNGEVEAGERLWITVSAAGLTGGGSQVRIHLEPWDLPNEDERGHAQRLLAVHDDVAQCVGLVVAQLLDWHHLTRNGRPPRLHTLLPESLGHYRRVLAAASLAGFLIAEHDGVVEKVHSLLGRAQVAIEAGLNPPARDLVDELDQFLNAEPHLVNVEIRAKVRALRDSADALNDAVSTPVWILDGHVTSLLEGDQ